MILLSMTSEEPARAAAPAAAPAYTSCSQPYDAPSIAGVFILEVICIIYPLLYKGDYLAHRNIFLHLRQLHYGA